MKIGAKEMKKAYKDVKLDQIDVSLLSIYHYRWYCYTVSNISEIIIHWCFELNQAQVLAKKKPSHFIFICISRNICQYVDSSELVFCPGNARITTLRQFRHKKITCFVDFFDNKNKTCHCHNVEQKISMSRFLISTANGKNNLKTELFNVT